MSGETPPRAPTWSYQNLRRGFVTAELISGTVLVSVVIAVADERNGIADVFVTTILSVLVFWVTQVFVVAVAVQGVRSDEEAISLRRTFRMAVRRSNGLLVAAVPPLVVLLIGIFGLYQGEVAYWIALWLGVAILAVLGWIAFAGRGIPWYWRACGAVATAAFGVLAILLKILVS